MSEPGAGVASASRLDHTLRILRAHLDEIGFVRFHKYLITPERYLLHPNVFGDESRLRLAALERWAFSGANDLALASCLMADIPVRYAGLDPKTRAVADALVEGRLLLRDEGVLRMAGLRLISFRDAPLLVDRRLNEPGPTHEVYLGPDSLLLTHYVDHDRICKRHRALDLGTGSGAIALFLARLTGETVATDAFPTPLWLADVNRRLNGCTNLTLRRESYLETIERGERYDIVTFNPPFIAFPDGLSAPVFARGLGRDGLDYCRMLIELFDHVVAPTGTAYMVADMPGDDEQPFLVADMERYAREVGLCFDAYLVQRLDYRESERQLEVYAYYAAKENPDVDASEVYERIRNLQRVELGAECAYLTILVVRRPLHRPYVRVHRRPVRTTTGTRT